jgi:hypothetical protein
MGLSAGHAMAQERQCAGLVMSVSQPSFALVVQ